LQILALLSDIIKSMSNNLLSNISQDVKDLLFAYSSKGKKEVSSLTLLKELSNNINVKDYIKAENINRIKKINLDIDDVLFFALKEEESINIGEINSIHLLLSILKLVGSSKYNKFKEEVNKSLLIQKTFFANVDKKKNSSKSLAKEKAVQSTIKPSPNKKNLAKSVSKKFSTPKNKESSENKKNILQDNKFLYDLNIISDNFKSINKGRIIDRSLITNKIIRNLSKKENHSSLLVGSNKSGKSTLAINLNKILNSKDYKNIYGNTKLIKINLHGLTFPEVKNTLDLIIKETLTKYSKKYSHLVYFFDDIHLISPFNNLAFSPPLKSNFSLSKVKLSFISTCSHEYYEKFFETGLMHKWEKILIPDPSKDILEKIMISVKKDLEDSYSIKMSNSLLTKLLSDLNPNLAFDESLIHFYSNQLDNLFSNKLYEEYRKKN